MSESLAIETSPRVGNILTDLQQLVSSIDIFGQLTEVECQHKQSGVHQCFLCILSFDSINFGDVVFGESFDNFFVGRDDDFSAVYGAFGLIECRMLVHLNIYIVCQFFQVAQFVGLFFRVGVNQK